LGGILLTAEALESMKAVGDLLTDEHIETSRPIAEKTNPSAIEKRL